MDSVYLKVLNELDKMPNARSRYSNLIKRRVDCKPYCKR